MLFEALDRLPNIVAPGRERGLKLWVNQSAARVIAVSPARERGLKYASK